MRASRERLRARLAARALPGNLAPLSHRDFRLLFAGRFVSLLGDGAFLVALAWETYTISDAPTALSVVGIAMTVPLISLLLVGGLVSDRHDRRRVMMFADLVRSALLLVLAVLAASRAMQLWEMVLIVAVYGAAEAFFDPASDAILPQLLPEDELGQANALEQLVRPLALRLAGPALGGALVGVLGPSTAFLADGASFIVSASCLWRMSAGARVVPSEGPLKASSATRELREGWSYVRAHVWLWGTFTSAAVAYLLFMGPTMVLLPFMVKHVLRGNGVQLGIVLGAGGLGSIACAAAMGRSAAPAKRITFIYVVWTAATIAVAAYGVASAIWELMLASLVFNFLETAGTIVWATMKQRLVPSELLGRVSSLDWLISIGLLPVSLALTGPVSILLGVRTTLIAAGILGALATLAGLALPGMREVDRSATSALIGGSVRA